MDNIREEVRAASDIITVVSARVQLKKRGNSYIGLCPFHNEKTPSFYVWPDRGNYKCFGCDKSGDVFSFVMETESLTFPEALRFLAEKARIQIPERGTRSAARAQEYDRNSAALQFAARFYQQQLKISSAGQKYLERLKLTPATAEKFGLGWASPRERPPGPCRSRGANIIRSISGCTTRPA